MEIIEDCKLSCEIALNSANDLLFYDKHKNCELILNPNKKFNKNLLMILLDNYINLFNQYNKVLEINIDNNLTNIFISMSYHIFEQFINNILKPFLTTVNITTIKLHIKFLNNSDEFNIKIARCQVVTKNLHGILWIEIEDNGIPIAQVN